MHTVPRYSTIGIPLIPGVNRAAGTGTTCATVLFANLHGYDALVERLPPVEAVALLREFFDILTCAVLECGGQIFQLGEADMLAGFGVGDSRHSQIHEALAAARTIQRRFAPVGIAWQKKHSIDAGVGIGIHRGEVAIGVFGPPEHSALTLVGDAAHVAAQLCRRARAGEMLFSAAVHLPHIPGSAAVGMGEFAPLLHLTNLQLQGRSAPLDVWCAPAAARLQMPHAAGLGRAAHH
ncbi:MAG: adenylate/guanylate cyclase domain-containing protein [Steroidobacteraceae bacterium]